MYCTRILSLRKKDLLSSTLKCIMERQCIVTNNVDFSTRSQFRQYCRFIREPDPTKNMYTDPSQLKGIKGFLMKVGVVKYKLIAHGYLRYGHIVNKLNYSAFYEEFKMPDTFYSWFLVTELHVWMLMVRYMSEGKEGKVVRYNMVEAMWEDIDERVDKLGRINIKVKKKQMSQLSAQFNAALLDYDEGLLSDDKVLAAAIWRMFFNSENNNPEQIELVLIYMRKQILLLEKMSKDELFRNKKLDWIDLRSVR